MKLNPEKTKLDRLRVVIGLVLSLTGLVLLTIAGIGGFSSLTLTLAGALLVISGALIAGSLWLASLITDFLR